MTLKGKVLQTRDVPKHSFISYGRTYQTQQNEKLAVLSAGYGDGLPCLISNRGHVLINGEPAPIRGRVCMNLTMADITQIKGVAPGDEVVFLGTQKEGYIRGDSMAEWGDTISYEVFCSIGPKNSREYV